ncbi:MAG: hypothetical protein IPL32_13680 [Chloracidobacterium sp.]|nr:hypothetical protein [Chloracidobacterium sp.]
MDRKQLSSISKGIVIVAGIVCFAIAVANIAVATFTVGFLCVLAFSVLVAPHDPDAAAIQIRY